MKHIIEIDDQSKEGKKLIALLKSLKNKVGDIEFLTTGEIEEKEDDILARYIEEGLKSGFADQKEVMKKLGL